MPRYLMLPVESGIVNSSVAWSQLFPLSGKTVDFAQLMGYFDSSDNSFLYVFSE